MTAYPIFIPSKGRAISCHTAILLAKNSMKFTIVIEPCDLDSYSKVYPMSSILVMDKDWQWLSYKRNFIKNYARNKGYVYHWQLDDDITSFMMRTDGKNSKSHPMDNMRYIESYVRDYDNMGILWLCDEVFAWSRKDAIWYNKQVSTCVLIESMNDVCWEKWVIEDTDYCLQILYKWYCTALFNRILYKKKPNNKAKWWMNVVGTNYSEFQKRLCAKYHPHIRYKEVNGRWKVMPSKIRSLFTQLPRKRHE